MARTGFVQGIAVAFGLIALAACEALPVPPATKPQSRPDMPAARAPVRPPAAAATPSARSQALHRYYSQVQSDLLTQGLLRTDGGGVDTPYSASDVMRNFERIAFYDEYDRSGGLRASDGRAGGLRKWADPVQVEVEFGPSVPAAQRAADQKNIERYAARLARITGHPITSTRSNGNFQVLVMSEDDRAFAISRIKQIVPNINPSSLSIFRTLPRSIHCLVVAFSDRENDYTYRRAIAFIRSEHPDLLRLSCVHEELAQGLGLANDSPRARPSIFNDDDEFALLTSHDEELLRLLYHPRLTPGMSADEARPIIRAILAGQLAGPS